MHTIQDIVKSINLKDAFVRRCIRDMNDILNPYIERGEKNRLLLDPDVIPIFNYIKQDKDKGFSLPTIKRNLLNSNIQLKKDIKTINEELKTDCQTLPKKQSGNDKWIGVKAAVKLTGRSEKTIRRLIVTEFKDDPNYLKRDKSSQRGKWLINKQFLSNYFSMQGDHGHEIFDHSQKKNDRRQNTTYDHSQPANDQSQIVKLLDKQIEELKAQIEQKDGQLNNQTADFKKQIEKQGDDFKTQIAELKELLNKKDEQLNKQADDFKYQLNQKDQQIHQLHVLLKESKTSTIDYKPDDKVGIFSKVLMRFGL